MDTASLKTTLKSRTTLFVAGALVAGAVGSKMLWSDSSPAFRPAMAGAQMAPLSGASRSTGQASSRGSGAVSAVSAGNRQGNRASVAKPQAVTAAVAPMTVANEQAQAQVQMQAQTQVQAQVRAQQVAVAPVDESEAPVATKVQRVAAVVPTARRSQPSEVDSSSDTDGLFAISALKSAAPAEASAPAVAETKSIVSNANNYSISDTSNNALGERVISTSSTQAPGAVTDGLGPVFVDDANSYYMRFPASWSIRKFDGEPWVVECGDGRSALISVGFSAFPAEYTADDVNLEWVARRIKKRPDTQLVAQGYATIMNRKAVWSKSVGPMQMGGNSVKVVRTTYILPLGDGRVAEIRIAASPETYEKISGLMKNAVSTFRLVPKRAPETTVARTDQ